MMMLEPQYKEVTDFANATMIKEQNKKWSQLVWEVDTEGYRP